MKSKEKTMGTATRLAPKPKLAAKDLLMGAKGPDVKSLQGELVHFGHAIATDGVFGSKTDLAVRSFQRSHGLLPDGIVGPKTRHVLAEPHVRIDKLLADLVTGFGVSIREPAIWARQFPVLSAPCSLPWGMHLSADGFSFLKSLESQKNVSNHLYWPGGSHSGVTLGAGYDMGQRPAEDIVGDLQAIGLDEQTARKAALGQGKKGHEAQAFAHANKHLIDLTAEQEDQLLRNLVLEVEVSVKQWIHKPLLQHEFDALISFAYNINTDVNEKNNQVFGRIAHLINTGHTRAATDVMRKLIGPGADVIPRHRRRREREISLYLYGRYGHRNVGKKK
jgi:GH24 family phage-related lysozyme (muramidase)/peptidoglycan hydrolase-like protein with peptidoglycan-binding domain